MSEILSREEVEGLLKWSPVLAKSHEVLREASEAKDKRISDLEFNNRVLKAKAERMGEVILGGIDEAAQHDQGCPIDQSYKEVEL